jgi:hypothetical protein
MATVTGFTAARMLAIENSTIDDAQLSGDNLILIRHDGTQINVGSVRGATGAAGPTGEVSDAELAAAVAASETSAGRGIIAYDEVAVEQSMTFQDNAWATVTNLSVTFTPVVGRYYEFALYSSARVMGTTSPVDFRILRAGTEEVARQGAFCAIAGLTTGVSLNKVVLAPGSWAGSQTFTIGIRPQTNNEVQIKSADYASTFAVIDVGLP